MCRYERGEQSWCDKVWAEAEVMLKEAGLFRRHRNSIGDYEPFLTRASERLHPDDDEEQLWSCWPIPEKPPILWR